MKEFLGEKGQLNAVLELPEEGRIDFHIPKPVRVFFAERFESTFSLQMTIMWGGIMSTMSTLLQENHTRQK